MAVPIDTGVGSGASEVIEQSSPIDIPAPREPIVQEQENCENDSAAAAIQHSNLTDPASTFDNMDPTMTLPVDDGTSAFDLTEWLFGDDFGSAQVPAQSGWSLGDPTSAPVADPFPPRLLHAPGIGEFYGNNEPSSSQGRNAAPTRELTQTLPSEVQLFPVYPQPWANHTTTISPTDGRNPPGATTHPPVLSSRKLCAVRCGSCSR